MPWSHCSNEINDDALCPVCGITKDQWTVLFERTRVFQIGAKAKSNLKLRLWDADEEDVVPHEPFLIYTIDGANRLASGNLDEEGFVHIAERFNASVSLVHFPERGLNAVIPMPNYDPMESTPGRFACVSTKLYEFRLTDADDWIGWRLQDDEGQAIAEESYVLTLPDGTTREGTTDEHGRVMEEDVPAGLCTLVFPLIDDPCWAPRALTVGHDWEEEEPPPTTWVQVELIDEYGEPIPDEPYVLTLADGTTREGTTGQDGTATEEGIPVGTTTLVFTQIDTPCWKPDDLTTDHEDVEVEQVETTYVAFTLQDENERPVADEPYTLTLADGTTREGRTRSDGSVYEDELPEGTCQLVFPEIDTPCWRPNDLTTDHEDVEVEQVETTFVSIALVDDLGQPVPDERYVLTLPDGTTREGRLGSDGTASEDGLPVDEQCRLVFPDIDEECWTPQGVSLDEHDDHTPTEMEPTTFLAIALEDDQGEPIPDEPYTLTLPDGTERKGTLGPDGTAIEQELPENATCSLFFDEIDEGCWDALRLDTREIEDVEVEEPPETSWLTLALVDEDGKPAAGEKYVVTLPDGETREGTLDEGGSAVLDGVLVGTCGVSFPDIDQGDWS